MTTFLTGRSENGSEWTGLGEASRALGVNASTLRRWADAGLVRTFRTPGGHRRFSVGDLERLMGAGLDETQELDQETVERIRTRLARDAGTPRDWLDHLTPALREELGSLGRQMVTLLERYVSLSANAGSPDRALIEEEGATLGARYAAVLRPAGVSLTDAVTGFAYFRRGMDEALRAFAHQHGLTDRAAEGLWEQAAVLEDRLLVALTHAYEEAAGAAREEG